MNFAEATRSGMPFKRPHWKRWYIFSETKLLHEWPRDLRDFVARLRWIRLVRSHPSDKLTNFP